MILYYKKKREAGEITNQITLVGILQIFLQKSYSEERPPTLFLSTPGMT